MTKDTARRIDMTAKAINWGGGTLLDRSPDCTLHVQTRAGVVEVTPLPEDREEAGSVWGGNPVAYYVLNDGSRVYDGEAAHRVYEGQVIAARAPQTEPE